MKQRMNDASVLLKGYSGPPILVTGDDAAYVSNIGDPQNHWLYYAFRGFEVLKKRKPIINHFVTIATGPGIDAIGAMEILNPRRITVTDLVPAAIKIAKENIIRYQKKGKKNPVRYLIGNLCEPLGNDKADIIYANIPNIPIAVMRKNQLMDGITAASFFNPDTVEDIPSSLNKYLLALQYTFLLQAKKNLNPGGRIIINLGIRFPLQTIDKLFSLTGYNYKILYFGFKKQTEPNDTIPGYARHEKNNIVFTYYPYGKSINALKEKNIRTVKGLLHSLKPFAINSNKALKLLSWGEDVGHIVTVLGATPK